MSGATSELNALVRPETRTRTTARRGRATDWRASYARRLALNDLGVLTVVVFAVQLVWFGFENSTVAIDGQLRDVALSYVVLSVILIAAATLTLGVVGSREYRVLGAGSKEYRLVADGMLRLFGAIAIVAFLFQVDFARGYILLVLPLGIAGVVLSRWLWRVGLAGRRRKGECMSRVVLVGSAGASAAIARDLKKSPESGYLVVAVIDPAGAEAPSAVPDVPVYSLDRLAVAMDELEADTVVVTNSQDLSPQRIREISWSLEPGREHLVVVPGLTDIGGPRLRTRPVAGLPLVHVETPRYDGVKHFSKRAFDFVGSAVLITLLLPVFAIVAVLVKTTSPGPVLFRQQRIGHKGARFGMLKFRSMSVDAEERLEELRLAQGKVGNDVLFKLKEDPRVTRVGRILRRYSLDELPQLFNTLVGDMSLVGPRPPLEREVTVYGNHVHRRFLVKPGITGLWQVSGRSNLSWEESVRLDLFYVENWSLTGDLIILWRTARAVARRDGAY